MRSSVTLLLLSLVFVPESFAKCIPGKVKNYKSKFRSYRTGYFPHHSKMQGGYKDRIGRRLRTLQRYLQGKDEYVSVAMDHTDKRYPYGTILRIPAIEKVFGRCIKFKVVDTGGRFVGRGSAKIDICHNSRRHIYKKYTNGWTTVYKIK